MESGAQPRMVSHILIALMIQGIFWRVTGGLWIGAAVAIAFLLGREITQAEYRWIFEFGDGRRANLPLWGFADPRAWTLKSLADWLVPAGVVLAVARLKTVKSG